MQASVIGPVYATEQGEEERNFVGEGERFLPKLCIFDIQIMVHKGINSMFRQSTGWRSLAAIAALLLLGSGVAWGQEDDEQIESLLNLTTQQKAETKALREKFNSDLAPMKAQLKDLRAERKRLEGQGASKEQIKDVLEKIADQEIEITLLINQFKKDYLAILTPEQRRKLQELKDKN